MIVPILLGVLSSSPVVEEVPRSPRVVRTWGDLFEQPIITLRDGSQVRVGLEALEAPRDSAFLVYALLNGTRYGTQGEYPLGPLHVEVSPLDRLRDRPQWAMGIARSHEAGQTKHLLFATAIFLGSPGKYEVLFVSSDNKVVARSVITATAKAAAPWQAFGLKEEKEELLKAAPEQVAKADFSIRNAVPAAPRCHGYFPIMRRPDGAKEVPLTEPLPRWTFEKPDTRLQLRATPTSLFVDSAVILNLDDPRGQFLFRLWLNDKLLDPLKTLQRWDERKRLRQMTGGKQLHIEWDFNPNHIGAKRGDRVGVQLLYCPDGYQETGTRDREKRQDIMKSGPRLPLLTPKAEFVVR